MEKKELEELRIKDLFARLPYGVFVKHPSFEDEFVTFTTDWHPDFRDVKAYLRPMSDMTDEELLTYHRHCILVEENGYKIYYKTEDSIDYLRSIYVDFSGLIKLGEAIKAPKDMYKQKTNELSEEELIDKLLNASCEDFTKYMRFLGVFDDCDNVIKFHPKSIANIIESTNEAGYDIDMTLQIMHDEYIHVRYEGDYPNKCCHIIGLMDDNEDWINHFNLREVVKKHKQKLNELFANTNKKSLK